jgi:ABC-type transporter Mla maintaining outer membrane lipid asymmetry ATPase subunit MlaF
MAQEISQSSATLIEAVGASVQRTSSHRVVIEDVNWQVGAGEYWVVGGRHGSGKSAFLATMAGLQRPGAGVIRHFGRELAGLSEPESIALRKRVGFVFKGGGRMFPDLTVAENVALPLRYHRDWAGGEAIDAIQGLLEATVLTGLADGTAQSLTTGWQQRVGLARALALEPEVLFLDEPVAGLEASHRMWWRDFLEQLSQGAGWARGRKMTLIVATSDYSLWGGARRHFGHLKDGRWDCLGERSEIPEMN